MNCVAASAMAAQGHSPNKRSTSTKDALPRNQQSPRSQTGGISRKYSSVGQRHHRRIQSHPTTNVPTGAKKKTAIAMRFVRRFKKNSHTTGLVGWLRPKVSTRLKPA